MWSKDGLGVGSVLLVGDKLLIHTTAGKLVLAEASPKGYRELASADVTEAKTFALPALSAGRLYARGPSELRCLDVGVARASSP